MFGIYLYILEVLVKSMKYSLKLVVLFFNINILKGYGWEMLFLRGNIYILLFIFLFVFKIGL